MAYPALPDRRMAYDNDGTIIYYGRNTEGAAFMLTSGQMVELNDHDQTLAFQTSQATGTHLIWFFFPESREVTACWCQMGQTGLGTVTHTSESLQGSNDTGNGTDGTWETASFPSGTPIGWEPSASGQMFDSWRNGIKPVSFTGPKKTVRFQTATTSTSSAREFQYYTIQLYGEAAAGAMTHDLEYINHDDTPGVAYTAPEDFGDMPLGTSVVRQFRIKNTSATKTATNINIQCNDADFVIAENPAGPWVVTINLASLGPGAESPTYYVRCTTPAPGAVLAPRFARIVTVCDAGFFG